MGVQRVLDRQRMQLELRLDRSQLGLVRLVKADPHEVDGLLRPTAPLLDRYVGDASSAAVGRRRDQLAHASSPGFLRDDLAPVYAAPLEHSNTPTPYERRRWWNFAAVS